MRSTMMWTGALGAALAVVVMVFPSPTASVAHAARPVADTGRPGQIVSAEPLVTSFPGRATRVLYRSTNARGKLNVVSGTVIEPRAPAVGPRRLVAYGIGTQGLADRCAPSNRYATGSRTAAEARMVTRLLETGYAVVVPDLEGLGTPGDHTYRIQESQGNAVLDAVRATQELAVTSPDGPVALAGYSQGGGAAGSAAERAPSYAPELELVGAYVGGAPADFAATLRFQDGTFSSVLVLYALNGLRAAYPDGALDRVLNARGGQLLAETREQCVEDTSLSAVFLRSSTLTRDGRPVSAHLAEQPLAERVERQLIGGRGRAPKVPVLVAHTPTDEEVPFGPARDLARRWCQRGATVRFEPLAALGHQAAAGAGFERALPYLADRFAGVPAPSTC